MSVLFNHAIRWGLFPYNPISGPERKSGVRQSSKRQKAPETLELEEMQLILLQLSIREKAMVSLDMITGLRRGELAGLKWKDIDFANLLVNVVRSVVDQRTGKCKTEASAKPVPIDEYTAEDLIAWYRVTRYRDPEDWVFASDDPRLGENRGKQPSGAVEDHAVSHSTADQTPGDSEERVLAHVSALIYYAAHRQRRKREGGPGTSAACKFEDHDGRLRTGPDAGQAARAVAHREGSAGQPGEKPVSGEKGEPPNAMAVNKPDLGGHGVATEPGRQIM